MTRRNAYAIAAGVAAAMSSKPLDFAYFESVCETAEEAWRLEAATNNPRALAEARASRGR